MKRRWSKEFESLAQRVLDLRPGDLPDVPWILKESVTVQVGRSTFPGGPYMRITDNAAFLGTIQRDVQAGPDGPRARMGTLYEDLEAITRKVGK